MVKRAFPHQLVDRIADFYEVGWYCGQVLEQQVKIGKIIRGVKVKEQIAAEIKSVV